MAAGKYLWKASELSITRKDGSDEVREARRQNSIAMVILPSSVPGKNVCSFVRGLTTDRTRLIVAVRASDSDSSGFERLLRASLPDCEKRIRVIPAGDSAVDAISSAERNHHYKAGDALEIFCDARDADVLRHDLDAGRMDFDPTVLRIHPGRIPVDSAEDISSAVRSGDQAAMHRVLDPHVFSNVGSLAAYEREFSGKESIREFLSDVAPSRELAIRHLDGLLASALGPGYDELQYLGTGRNGSAYRSPDGLIMKVTTDAAEAAAAARLAGHTTHHLGGIYATVPLSGGVWLILQEELADLPEGLREELDLVVAALEATGGLDFLNSGDFDSALESLSLFEEEPEIQELAVGALQRFDVAGMCYELSMFGLTGDFHGGNVRMRGHRPVLTDLGTPGEDRGMVREYGTGAPGSGANGPPTMRGANSSSWSTGIGSLKQPQNHVPEDENETERDRALDWGPGRVSGASA